MRREPPLESMAGADDEQASAVKEAQQSVAGDVVRSSRLVFVATIVHLLAIATTESLA